MTDTMRIVYAEGEMNLCSQSIPTNMNIMNETRVLQLSPTSDANPNSAKNLRPGTYPSCGQQSSNLRDNEPIAIVE